MSKENQSLGYLLSDSLHTIEFFSLSPEDLKKSAKYTIRHTSEKIGHQNVLKLIPKLLGFKGDWGDYQNTHWPNIETRLRDLGCTKMGDLFPNEDSRCIDLYLNRDSVGPRQLADCIFESDTEPKRVFIGFGVDWSVWDRGNGHDVPQDALATIGGDPTTTLERAERLWEYRELLCGQWGFIDNRLIDGEHQELMPALYRSVDSGSKIDPIAVQRYEQPIKAFRSIFDHSEQGWVDIFPLTDCLVILRGYDGTWQPLWRNFRDEKPPTFDMPQEDWRQYLHPKDTPSLLEPHIDLQRELYFRKNFWDELEEYKAEQAYYDGVGSAPNRQNTPCLEVREAYLRKIGILDKKTTGVDAANLPEGFKIAKSDNNRLYALSEIINTSQFNNMMQQSGYQHRRKADPLNWSDQINDNEFGDLPALVTWADAQAFCRWTEDRSGYKVRLPTLDELKSLRPCRTLSQFGYPDVEDTYDFSGNARVLSWKDDKASWKHQPNRITHNGFEFIDHLDINELCQNFGHTIGRYSLRPLAKNCTGAYKAVQVTFRLAISVEEKSYD